LNHLSPEVPSGHSLSLRLAIGSIILCIRRKGHAEDWIMNDETPGSITAAHRAAEEKIADPWLMAQQEQDAFELHEHPEAYMDAASAIADSRQGAGPKSLPVDPVGAVVAAFARDHDITRTPDKFAIPAARHGAQQLRTVFVASAVLAALGLGWIGGLNWNRFFGPASVSVPLQQDFNRSAQALDSDGVTRSVIAKADREVTASAPNIGKIPSARATGVGRGPDSSQAAPPPAPTSESPVSSVARQNAVSSGPATAAVEHGSKIVARLTPTPETKPTTIEGWTVRQVVGGRAVLEGPGGILTATPGDTVPGVGKVNSIVRWGSHWIVATSRGLISTQ